MAAVENAGFYSIFNRTPKHPKEIIFFFTNIGEQPQDADPDYFTKAREVMKLLTEKQIYLRPKSEVGMFLVGGKETSPGSTGFRRPIEVPTWQTVKDILMIDKSDEPFYDWYTGLSEVLEYLRPNISAKLTPTPTILVLLFDCNGTFPGLGFIDIQAIADAINALNIELRWIGSKQLKNMPTEELSESERVLLEIVELTGKYVRIDKALASYRIFENHKRSVTAWKCHLKIGSISIPTVTYVKAVDDIKLPSFTTVDSAGTDDVKLTRNMAPENYYVDRHGKAHSEDDTIPGYMFGRKFIPVPKPNAPGMVYNSGLKSFNINCFVSRASLTLADYAGSSSEIVLPDGPEAVKPFYCMAKAMVDEDLVGIVERIYHTRADPKMAVLHPHINIPNEPACLILIEMPFAEDRRVVQSSLPESIIKGLTKEKMDAVANLIDSMMLTGPKNKGKKRFNPGEVPSPGLQHVWNSLTERALNPNAPVPSMDEHLKELLEPSKSIRINSKPFVEKVKEVFGKKEAQGGSKKTSQYTNATGGRSAKVPDPSQTEVTKIENIVKKSMEESTSHSLESDVDPDVIIDSEYIWILD